MAKLIGESENDRAFDWQAFLESGNTELLRGSELQGLLASALIASSAFSTPSTFLHTHALESILLIASAGLTVFVHLGLGFWRTWVVSRYFKKQSLPKTGTILFPTILLGGQSVLFFSGLTLFLTRLIFK
jgi:hypothetical protein